MNYIFKIFATLMAATFTFAVIIFSCTDDRNPEAEKEVILETDPAVFIDSCIGNDGKWIPCNVICDLGLIITETDTLLFSDARGTICCVTGPAEADPGDTLTFIYNRNLKGSALTVTWDVREGSLTLIDGQHTPVATFLCGEDFDGGTVIGYGIAQFEDNGISYTLACSSGSDIIKK